MKTESTFTHHEPCPACRKKGGDWGGDNLSRYSDGHGYCHACGHYEHGPDSPREGRGRAPTPQSQGRPMSKAPLIEDVNIVPIKARGIRAETCQKFNYGVGKYKGQDCHVAPFYDAKGNLTAQHLRFQNKDFKWTGDPGSVCLFGQHLWRHGGRRVVVTEGELDCMSVSQLQDNKWPVVSLPNGAQSAAKYVRACLEWLESFEVVVLAFDMDEPGQTAAKECAALLKPGKAHIARLPEHDANDCLMHNKGKELINALWDAQPYRPDGIRAGLELLDDILQPPPAGYEIPYPELNDMLSGLRLGEVYLFTAGSGIGKSTLVNELGYHLLMRHGLSLGVMALEESCSRNARRYLGIHLNKPLHRPEAHKSLDPDDLRRAHQEVMGSGRWWIYDHFGSSNIDTLLSKIRYMAVGLGVKVLVLDHISIIVSGLDEASEGESERKTIDRLMTSLRSLVEETGIMVLAVVHLKRPGDKGKSFNEGRQVSLTDLRGSASLEQVSDAVIALERDQQGDNSNQSHIRVLKNRPTGQTGPAGSALYYPETGRLLPCEEHGGHGYGFGNETSNQTQPEF